MSEPILPALARQCGLSLAAALLAVPALAQTPLKFQLAWHFEGPASLFLAPLAKGHSKAAGLAALRVAQLSGAFGTKTWVDPQSLAAGRPAAAQVRIEHPAAGATQTGGADRVAAPALGYQWNS